jgi:allophanate hydrolase subunit 1
MKSEQEVENIRVKALSGELSKKGVSYFKDRNKAENEAIYQGCRLENFEVWRIHQREEWLFLFLGFLFVGLFYLFIGFYLAGGL